MASKKINKVLETEVKDTIVEIERLKYSNAISKVSYIQEIKNGLGDEIKKTKGYKKDKISIFTKISRFFDKLFRMF